MPKRVVDLLEAVHIADRNGKRLCAAVCDAVIHVAFRLGVGVLALDAGEGVAVGPLPGGGELLLSLHLCVHVAYADDDVLVPLLVVHADDLAVYVHGGAVHHEPVGGGERAAGGKLRQQPLLLPHGQGLVEVVLVHEAQDVLAADLEEVLAALFHLQIVVVAVGAVLDELVRVGVHIVDAVVVL